ncbi:MAG: hypothetical protein HY301_02310 [Verrucomicrobia bacterium]|nr:hypothetical protein [Verrucomicrobiota bacterium]
MFESPLLIVLVILAALGVGIGVFSLRRRKRVRRLCSQAAQAIEESRHDEALRILLAVERSWAFNLHDGSRSSRLADLDDLSQMLTLLARVPGGDTSRITLVESAVSEVRALFAERSNFGIDGRSLKRDGAVRWPELSDRLQSARQELRASYETRVAA